MNYYGKFLEWKPYYSFDAMLKERFSTKVYKVALNGGMSCPNRDGTLGNGGCIFCSAGGSGDFAGNSRDSITTQIKIQLTALEKNVGQKNLLPIFKRTQTPTLPLTIWKNFYRGTFLSRCCRNFYRHTPRLPWRRCHCTSKTFESDKACLG